ncbi:Triggering receptor expressed on myeloid cells 1 [Tupaia chinensis]|uniref:Triggering receptor expressed on myeloid cells 1 n=2 Tax=Tupaia chinensis TaxID=246437 RepID=L9KUC5_TUPCH|nr:Triggering receptor expressed on myeloid cells 1 [Tupaia chinensis]
MLLVAELQAAGELIEKHVLAEGQNLTVSCPFNIQKYARSRKAWQRLKEGQEPLNLAIIDRPSGTPSQVQVERYMLEDLPEDGMLHVRMINLRVEDSGLYRCVIYHPPRDPVVLYDLVRLVVTPGSSGTPTSDQNSIQKLPRTTTLPPVITKAFSISYTRSRAVTEPPTTSPGLGVNVINVTDVTRIPVFSIVVPIACGLLSKSLVFTVLFAVTQRSFGH